MVFKVAIAKISVLEDLVVTVKGGGGEGIAKPVDNKNSKLGLVVQITKFWGQQNKLLSFLIRKSGNDWSFCSVSNHDQIIFDERNWFGVSLHFL